MNKEENSNPKEDNIKVVVKAWKLGKNTTHILSLNLSNYSPTNKQFVLSLANNPSSLSVKYLAVSPVSVVNFSNL